MTGNRTFRLALFSSLYFAQGAMMSYFLTYNILYLGEYGYSEADVGIFQAVLAIPFVLKIFLGMLSDGVNLFGLGHRKPYILIGLVMQGVALVTLASISPADTLGPFVLLALLASISMALYDTCTDGLALDVTPADERGTVQGLMTGARAAGILVMLLLGGVIIEAIGWKWVFYSVALLSLPPFLLALRIKETPQEISRQEFSWSAFRAFGRTATLMLAGMGLIYALALDGIYTFLSDHLRDMMQVTIGNVGLFIALAMVGRIVGALSNSWLTDRIGQKRSLWIAIVLTSAGSVGLAIGGSLGMIAAAAFLFGLAYGYYTSIYAAVAMEYSNPSIAASMFAIFMMFVNLGTVGGQALGGILTEKLGFGGMCLVMGGINLLNILLAMGVFRERPPVESAVG